MFHGQPEEKARTYPDGEFVDFGFEKMYLSGFGRVSRIMQASSDESVAIF